MSVFAAPVRISGRVQNIKMCRYADSFAFRGDFLMKKEKGAATLIEYAIVLPIVFAIVFMLIFVGFTMHQKAVMEAATQRSAIYVARTITDPSYENIGYSFCDHYAGKHCECTIQISFLWWR